MFGKSSELCFDNADYVFLFRIMFSNSLNCFFGSSNHVWKASELRFDNLNSNCAR